MICVCQARYYRGVGQLTDQFKTAENRHAVKIGTVLARVVIQRSMVFHSSGKRRTVASTSRASPPPPTNSNGLGVMRCPLRLLGETASPGAVDD